MGDMKWWRVKVSYRVSLIWHSMTAMLLSAQQESVGEPRIRAAADTCTRVAAWLHDILQVRALVLQL
jgi:hypothetical protein